ncbi:hypothetical protein SFR_1214 [Streptomyces sp. FR-008]|nr:hypothetical protein SFR_1214 [Streptomyces sp. FR-008]
MRSSVAAMRADSESFHRRHDPVNGSHTPKGRPAPRGGAAGRPGRDAVRKRVSGGTGR